MKALKNFYGPVTGTYYTLGANVSKEDAEAAPKGFVKMPEKKSAPKPTKKGPPKGAKKK